MFKIGQKVWDVVRGEGKVVEVRADGYNYPVVVEFSDEHLETYTKEGLEDKSHKKRSLYPYPVAVMKYVSKPSINWEHVREEYKFLAQDADGSVWLYSEEPTNDGRRWLAAGGEYAEAQSHVTYRPGTCDWQDSLVERP